MRFATTRLASIHASDVPPSSGKKNSLTRRCHCSARWLLSFMTPPSSRNTVSCDIDITLLRQDFLLDPWDLYPIVLQVGGKGHRGKTKIALDAIQIGGVIKREEGHCSRRQWWFG